MRTIPTLSLPNVCIGGPEPDSPGFPLKACGNDELVIHLTQQAVGNWRRFEYSGL